MITYEELVEETPAILDDDSALPINLKGIYVETSLTKMILINKNIATTTERKCILAEELGHHYTSTGDIIDQSDINHRKQELKARQWGYDRLVPLSSLVQAYHARVKGKFELAEYLGVTEEFLQAAIDRYKSIYGIHTTLDNYIIRFEPLGIAELFE